MIGHLPTDALSEVSESHLRSDTSDSHPSSSVRTVGTSKPLIKEYLGLDSDTSDSSDTHTLRAVVIYVRLAILLTFVVVIDDSTTTPPPTSRDTTRWAEIP